MSESLVVHLNRNRPQEVELETTDVQTTGSFVIVLENHGAAMHVHLHLDDTLSSVARLDAGNHFVDSETTTEVHVDVAGSQRPLSGKLKIVTGYGSETVYANIELIEPEETHRYVQVDETLSKPRPTDVAEESFLDRSVVRNGLVAAFGGFAILLAAFVAAMAGSIAVMVGALVVLVGVGVAIVLIVR